MDLNEINRRIDDIDKRLDTVNFELGKLVGRERANANLIKYVILPLISIVAALAGVKIVI